jgi:hypothetical protein
MEDQFEITYEGNCIKVQLQGNEDLGVASCLWPQILEACKDNDCFKVLGIAETTNPLGTMDAYNHAELFNKLGINHQYRIAWVELNPEAYEATQFAETVLKNRGLPGRLFADVSEAKQWLLNEAK